MRPPRTRGDAANAFQQAVGALREAWKSNERYPKREMQHLSGTAYTPRASRTQGIITWRVLTEEPYFQAPGDEKRINITDREFTIVDLIK